MTCPSTAPGAPTACTLDDTAEAHIHGHGAPTDDGLGRTVWGVTLDDYTRWDTPAPDQLLVWDADARAALETPAPEEQTEPAPEPVEATQ